MTSLQSGSCACESVTHAYTKHTRLHRCTRRHQHTQINFSSQRWILCAMLLISILANSCTGASASAHPRSRLCPLPHLNLDPALSPVRSTCLQLNPTTLPPQSHTTTRARTHTRTQTHVHAHAYAHTHTRTQRRAHTHAHTQTPLLFMSRN